MRRFFSGEQPSSRMGDLTRRRTQAPRLPAIDYCDAVGRAAEQAFHDLHGLAPDLSDVIAIARRLDRIDPARAATDRIRRLVRDCMQDDVSSTICSAMLVKVHLEHVAAVSSRRAGHV